VTNRSIILLFILIGLTSAAIAVIIMVALIQFVEGIHLLIK
jgi:hypothetical protein